MPPKLSDGSQRDGLTNPCTGIDVLKRRERNTERTSNTAGTPAPQMNSKSGGKATTTKAAQMA